MKKYFEVSFKRSESVYCSNIAHAETVEAVKAHYSIYEWIDIRECDGCEVEEARRRGKPIVEVEAPKKEENTMNDERYDYREAVKNDVLEYIRSEINFEDFEDLEELEQQLNDDLWISDSVTGNASGSYYCNAWKAESALCHNFDLLADALEEFGGNMDILKDGAESCDVTIRCYLLNECIADALEEIKDEFNEMHEGGNEE